jgi:hypothetical protein
MEAPKNQQVDARELLAIIGAQHFDFLKAQARIIELEQQVATLQKAASKKAPKA